ncbi:MAG: SulP family inorganic anion transporter, partial [Anaerolineae bacterium]|nr:SulP family inorganic anion transporter [Anaerolineae bacterium]
MNATLRSPPRQATGSVLRQLWAVSAFFTRPAAIIRTYPRNALPRDLVAGLTVALVVLPQAIAYALIAELPPQMGLYAAIVGSIVGALWGSSHHLQTGPTNAASLLVLSVLLTISTPGTPDYLIVAGMMALLVGIFRLVIGLARLGILVNFVSDSVIVGFTAGAGLLIFLNQLRNLLRLNVASTPALGETLQGVVTHLDETHVPSLALGVGAILIILLLRRLSRRLPGPLIAMVATSFAVGLLGLGNQGVKVIGQLPRGLPPLTPLPLLELELIGKLSTGALAVAGIGLVEAMSIARSIASKTGQRLDSNQEFVGQGLANIACGFLSGYTCSGSFTRSAVNFEAGALTSLSSVFCGLFVLAAVLGLAPLAAYIPLSALAGVLAVTAYSLIDRRSMARIWRGGGGDRVIMVVTLLATLLLPLQFAVLTGILMSLAYYLLQTSTPQVRPVLPNDTFTHFVYRPDKPPCPQLGIIEILGDLYFGAVHHIEESIQENSDRNPSQRFLLLRMHSIEHCDVSGIHALEHIARTYREHGGDLYLTRVGESVMEIMRATGFDQFLGADHLL